MDGRQHRGGYRGGRGIDGGGRGGMSFEHRGRGGGAPRSGGGYGGDRPLRKLREVRDGFGPVSGIGTGGWIEQNATVFKPPQSKGIGLLYWRTIPIETNHVETWITFPDQIHHYELNVTYGDRLDSQKQSKFTKKRDAGGSEEKTTEVRPKLWKKVVQHVLPLIEKRNLERNGSSIIIASDFSKALYTIRPLDGIDELFFVDAKDMTDESDDSTSSFIVTVAATRSIIDTKALSTVINNMRGKELSNMAEIEQVYNIVLKTLPIYEFIHVGRASFFTVPENNGYSLGGGLVNIAGFSSIYTFGWKAFINIDVANSAFILGRDVLEVLRNLFQSEFRSSDPIDVSTWGPRETTKVNELLKTSQVTYARDGVVMRRRVEEVLSRRPCEYKFKIDNKETNVEAYFKDKNINLKFKRGPILIVGKSKAAIPAELCCVEKGQSFTKKLADYQTAAMIKDTAKPPAERRQRIMESIKACNLEKDRVLSEFGVRKFGAGEGTAKLLHFEKSRVLPTPDLCYGHEGKQRATAIDGVWNIWEHDFRFIVPIKVIKWRVLYMNSRSTNLQRGRQELDRFVGAFRRMSKQSGMDIPDYEACDWLDVERVTFERDLTEYFGNLDYVKEKAFVLVVIPQKNHTCYGTIKKVAELGRVGVLTQCVVGNNIMKNQSATVGNIILKLNAKLGGVNHAIDLTVPLKLQSMVDFVRFPILLLGADVTHPSANSLMPSVAAVTASYDRYGMQYCMHPQVQKRADKNAAEVIENLDTIVAKMLDNYRRNTGIAPKKIFYFRDGVGEGQYAEVLLKELGALRKACLLASNNSGKYMPKITFITVQKRHKTRFFVTKASDGIGKSGNAPPGTIVDTEIIHPTETDFYLLSHQGIQGTSRPTRYHLLWDDSDFSPDEIQILTYALCHAYSRCARTVSIPAPTYYAHLAAYRVRCQIEAMPPTAYENIQKLNELVQRNEEIIGNFPMYFI